MERGDRKQQAVSVPPMMREQYAWYRLATDVFFLLSQGEEGDQGPSGEVGAQGPPVKYFLLNSVIHLLYYVISFFLLLVRKKLL